MMDPAVAVLLAMVVCIIPLAIRAKNKLDDKIDKVRDQCNKVKESVIVTQTKVDMLLDHHGFDMHKVKKAISENMEEIEKNDQPSVGGCINIKDLRKEE